MVHCFRIRLVALGQIEHSRLRSSRDAPKARWGCHGVEWQRKWIYVFNVRRRSYRQACTATRHPPLRYCCISVRCEQRTRSCSSRWMAKQIGGPSGRFLASCTIVQYRQLLPCASTRGKNVGGAFRIGHRVCWCVRRDRWRIEWIGKQQAVTPLLGRLTSACS